MIVAFDNTFLTLVLNPASRPRPNPATGQPVSHCRQRIDALIDTLSKNGDSVIIPAPTLAEALVATEDLDAVVKAIERYEAIEIVPFNARAAYEYAEIVKTAIDNGDKRSGSNAEWQKIKFDRQIVATSKAHGAERLYTDDDGQTGFAELSGLTVVHTWNLDLPPEYAQMDFERDGQKATGQRTD